MLLLGLAMLMTIPRLYIGGHYASDAIGGLLLAVGCVVLVRQFSYPILAVGEHVLAWAERAPYYFYPIAFLVTFEMAYMFSDVQFVLRGLLKILLGD